MEVVNLENENNLINTKVFVIDRNGNIYKNGDIFSDIRHKMFLLEIADVLYPGNEIAKTLEVDKDLIFAFSSETKFNRDVIWKVLEESLSIAKE